MGVSGDISIGERLRFYRQAQHKTQAVISGLAEITEDYLSQVERGLKTPTVGVLQRLAAVLGLPVSVLLGEPSYASESVIHPIAPAIQAALMSYGHGPDAEPEPLPALHARVRAAWLIWQTAPLRYTGAAALLPTLTADVQNAVRAARENPAQARQAAAVATDLYFLLRTFTKRIGRPDLALLAADRAMAAAQDAQDPLRVLGAEWNLGQILLSQGQAQAALEVAVRSAERLEPRLGDLDDQYAALCGAQWLNAATASVRLRDSWGAREILREHAEPIARRIPERITYPKQATTAQFIPADLAAEVKAYEIPVSAICQTALRAAVKEAEGNAEWPTRDGVRGRCGAGRSPRRRGSPRG